MSEEEKDIQEEEEEEERVEQESQQIIDDVDDILGQALLQYDDIEIKSPKKQLSKIDPETGFKYRRKPRAPIQKGMKRERKFANQSIATKFNKLREEKLIIMSDLKSKVKKFNEIVKEKRQKLRDDSQLAVLGHNFQLKKLASINRILNNPRMKDSNKKKALMRLQSKQQTPYVEKESRRRSMRKDIRSNYKRKEINDIMKRVNELPELSKQRLLRYVDLASNKDLFKVNPKQEWLTDEEFYRALSEDNKDIYEHPEKYETFWDTGMITRKNLTTLAKEKGIDYENTFMDPETNVKWQAKRKKKPLYKDVVSSLF